MFWAFLWEIKYLPKESSNQSKRGRVCWAGRWSTALFRVSAFSCKGSWWQSAPGDPPGRGLGGKMTGLHRGLEGLGTKDRCGRSSPSQGECSVVSSFSAMQNKKPQMPRSQRCGAVTVQGGQDNMAPWPCAAPAAEPVSSQKPALPGCPSWCLPEGLQCWKFPHIVGLLQFNFVITLSF